MSPTGRTISIGESQLKHRLYFRLPDIPGAEQAIRDLLIARIAIPQIHCLARRGMPLGELPKANFLQKADVMQDAGAAMAFGGALGAIIGGLLVLFPPAGAILHGGTMPIAAVAGAVFGVWFSSATGIGVHNSTIAVLEQGDAGNILLVVDVPYARSREISDLVHLRHPAALLEETAPGIQASV